jgi:HlyD family secretion protein
VSNAALRFRPRTNDTSAVSGGHQPGALAATSRRADAGASGQVFVLGADAGLTRIPLLLGITDGAMTEVLSGNLAEGQNVVLGYVSGTSGSSRRGYFSLRLQ